MLHLEGGLLGIQAELRIGAWTCGAGGPGRGPDFNEDALPIGLPVDLGRVRSRSRAGTQPCR